jgi:UPF0755 protein
VVLAVAAAVAAGLSVWHMMRVLDAPGPLAQPKVVIIPKGTGLLGVGRDLVAAGIIRDPRGLALYARLHGLRPKAGEYRFPARVSPRQALALLVSGRTVIHKLTVPEGLTVREVVALLAKADYLTGPVTPLPMEGSLLPNTWYLSRGESRMAVIGRMRRRMREMVAELWAARAANLPLANPEQAVVLASIVERETALPGERPKVAAVFENRLTRGMRLQSDPTVIYGVSHGLGQLDRPLTRADLETPSRWNTYLIDGLPPTPICNPGRASLLAVLHPADSRDLYFVANGTGGHSFARTLRQQNANVAQWRKIEAGKTESRQGGESDRAGTGAAATRKTGSKAAAPAGVRRPPAPAASTR